MDSTIIYDQIPSIALAVCAILLAALAVSVGSRLRKDTGVHIRKPLFDSAGRSFYSLMDEAVGEHFSLFPDLPLGEVLFTDEYQRPIPAWLLDAQFDMLLCGHRSLTPRCAILVADRSTKKGCRRVDQMRVWFDKAGLPLLVYEVGGLLDVRTLREDVYIAVGVEYQNHCNEVLESASVFQTVIDQPNKSNALATSDQPNKSKARAASVQPNKSKARAASVQPNKSKARATSARPNKSKARATNAQPNKSKAQVTSAQPKTSKARACGKCGDKMVKRVLKQNDHAGRKAWVCSNYPKCRSAIMIASEISS